MAPTRIALVGMGKIAADQHVPTIAADDRFRIAAVVSRRGLTVNGAPVFATLEDLLAGDTPVDAVCLCTPPEAHFPAARAALAAGKHVLLEKPPTATLAELAELERLAARSAGVLFATWHSRFNLGVERLRDHLSGRRLSELVITWKEDVRRWHPGQAWIWEAGGFGVFDPGINALSILTAVVPQPVFVKRARLSFPSNRRAPIAAAIDFHGAGPDAPCRAEFDWRQEGPQTWRFDIATTDGGRVVLDGGGRALAVDGERVVAHDDAEYAGIYARFAELIGAGRSDVDAAPLRLVADAFLLGERKEVAPFHDAG